MVNLDMDGETNGFIFIQNFGRPALFPFLEVILGCGLHCEDEWCPRVWSPCLQRECTVEKFQSWGVSFVRPVGNWCFQALL